MIATFTNQGKTRWMIIDEAVDKFIDFLQALINPKRAVIPCQRSPTR
jgi:hypothetical protein